ncbi:hypothetical protein AAFF_G00160550 [Aldrovandia affinis]|uniref:Uncharacterized protein n=1 Tax=Aldrovandia affinis TaxID=143900 RepID=A0AAD7RN42_9TELE|nr:hypothetical protein AAFF_G00160550 [Aldrovandia affinis]
MSSVPPEALCTKRGRSRQAQACTESAVGRENGAGGEGGEEEKPHAGPDLRAEHKTPVAIPHSHSIQREYCPLRVTRCLSPHSSSPAHLSRCPSPVPHSGLFNRKGMRRRSTAALQLPVSWPNDVASLLRKDEYRVMFFVVRLRSTIGNPRGTVRADSTWDQLRINADQCIPFRLDPPRALYCTVTLTYGDSAIQSGGEITEQTRLTTVRQELSNGSN